MWSRNCSSSVRGPPRADRRRPPNPRAYGPTPFRRRGMTHRAPRDGSAPLLCSSPRFWGVPCTMTGRVRRVPNDGISPCCGRDGSRCTPDDRFALSSAAVERLRKGRRGRRTGATERRRHPGGNHGANTGRARPQCCCSARQAAGRPLSCLEQPDRDGFVLAGLGEALTIEARGPGRFGRSRAVRGKWRARRSATTRPRIPTRPPAAALSSWAASPSRTRVARPPNGPACRPQASCCRNALSRQRGRPA